MFYTYEIEYPQVLTNIYISIRIYPHLQDSGGFFVAVLEKIKEPASHSEIIM